MSIGIRRIAVAVWKLVSWVIVPLQNSPRAQIRNLAYTKPDTVGGKTTYKLKSTDS
jgi:hypothetical protein